MIKKACFPGSFDPFTKGHEDIVRRGLGLFDEILIAVGHNSSKQPFFEVQSRVNHIAGIFGQDSRIQIATYSELTVDFAKRMDCTHLLRGLRDTKDYSYEHPIALMNRTMTGMETVFLLPAPELIAIHSTIVREIYKNGGKIDAFVTNAEQLVKTV